MDGTWQIDKASVMRKAIIIGIGIANICAVLLFFMWANAHFKGWERVVKVEVEVIKEVEKPVFKGEKIIERLVYEPKELDRLGIMELTHDNAAKIYKGYDPDAHTIYAIKINETFDASIHKGGESVIYIITWPDKFSKPTQPKP